MCSKIKNHPMSWCVEFVGTLTLHKQILGVTTPEKLLFLLHLRPETDSPWVFEDCTFGETPNLRKFLVMLTMSSPLLWSGSKWQHLPSGKLSFTWTDVEKPSILQMDDGFAPRQKRRFSPSFPSPVAGVTVVWKISIINHQLTSNCNNQEKQTHTDMSKSQPNLFFSKKELQELQKLPFSATQDQLQLNHRSPVTGHHSRLPAALGGLGTRGQQAWQLPGAELAAQQAPEKSWMTI